MSPLLSPLRQKDAKCVITSAFLGQSESGANHFYGLVAKVVPPEAYVELDAMKPEGRPTIATMSTKRQGEARAGGAGSSGGTAAKD